MFYVCLYLGVGALAYFMMRLLFRKTGVGFAGLHLTWTGGANRNGDFLVLFGAVLLWPLSLLASLLWWLGDFQHVKEQKRKAKLEAERTWYDRISTTELIARQQKAMEQSDANRLKDTKVG